MSYSVPPLVAHRLLLVTITFRNGPPKTSELEPVFNQATDWFRYAPNCWLLWTSGTPDSWYPHVRDQIKDSDYLLIVEVSPNQLRGWLPRAAWDWMRKYRTV